LLAACDTADTENEAPQVAPSIPHDLQHSDDGADDRPSNSIYSPTYHHHKDGGLNNLSKAGSLEEQTAPVHGSKESSLKSGPNLACNTCDGASDHSCTLNLQSTGQSTLLEVDEYSELGNLSSEVSAIYLAMQQSKLECIDEQSQDSTSTEGYGDAEETEEYDEFDPYSFIKDLPDLSTVVPKFRPVLLPKQTRSCPTTTLVLDLDETLVHSTLEHCEDADFTFPVHFNFREHTIYVRCRPYLKEFMERVASMFETIIFTASQSIYAEQLLNVLDPKRKLFRHRVYRESCVYVEGNYLKDLTVLGRDLTRVMIVDNSPQVCTIISFSFLQSFFFQFNLHFCKHLSPVMAIWFHH
jgi:CTD small phosphatase-like protein 2